MSLLHAVWLPNPGAPHLALWADTWRVAKPRKLDGLEAPLLHPLALEAGDLKAWLEEIERLPAEAQAIEVQLTLPSRSNGLPLMAGEAIPKTVQWWPWRVPALAMAPADAASWLGQLPLASSPAELGDDLSWWAHLQRWALSLAARGPLAAGGAAAGARPCAGQLAAPAQP